MFLRWGSSLLRALFSLARCMAATWCCSLHIAVYFSFFVFPLLVFLLGPCVTRNSCLTKYIPLRVFPFLCHLLLFLTILSHLPAYHSSLDSATLIVFFVFFLLLIYSFFPLFDLPTHLVQGHLDKAANLYFSSVCPPTSLLT